MSRDIFKPSNLIGLPFSKQADSAQPENSDKIIPGDPLLHRAREGLGMRLAMPQVDVM